MNIQNIWYRKNLFSWILWPFSWIYRAAVFVRYHLYRLGIKKTVHFPVPIIVVGNMTVGGTGKTPLTIALVNWLQQQGRRPGIVSRGYGGTDISAPQIVNSDSDPKRVGDEAVLMAQATACPLVVAQRRTEAVSQLLRNYPCDIVISDDGLQHLALSRDVEIVVIDGDRRWGNGFCLPAGPLREPLKRLKGVDLKVCKGVGRADEWSMNLIPEQIYRLTDPTQKLIIEDLGDRKIHAVAGIGNPDSFFRMLKNMGIAIIPHVFSDHHEYKKKDLDFGIDSLVIMTEKDAVKCRAFGNQNHWCLRIRAEVSPLFFQRVIEKAASKFFRNCLHIRSDEVEPLDF